MRQSSSHHIKQYMANGTHDFLCVFSQSISHVTCLLFFWKKEMWSELKVWLVRTIWFLGNSEFYGTKIPGDDFFARKVDPTKQLTINELWQEAKKTNPKERLRLAGKPQNHLILRRMYIHIYIYIYIFIFIHGYFSLIAYSSLAGNSSSVGRFSSSQDFQHLRGPLKSVLN